MMKRNLLTVMLSMVVMFGGAGSAGAAVIYVDFAHTTDSAYQTGSNWANVRDSGDSDGTTSDLVDINNVATGIDVKTEDVGYTNAGDGLMPDSGTDAYNLFNGYVNGEGNAGGSKTVTFSGLDPTLTYDVAFFGNRSDSGDRGSGKFTISDADSFNNISSSGIYTKNVENDSADVYINNNTSTGEVARWNQIDPGSDGDFSVYETSGATPYLNAARLEAIPEPASALLLLLAAGIGLFHRRSGS